MTALHKVVTTKKVQRNAKTKVGKTKLALGEKTVKAKTAAEKNKKTKQTALVTGTERANQLAEKVDQEDNNARAARLAKIRESIPADEY